MVVPPGTVPVSVAVSVADCPAQIVTVGELIIKLVTAPVEPVAPRVAPLGGNSVRPREPVIPLIPPFRVWVGVPAEVPI